MLYDPKWEVKTKSKKPTLVGMIAWLETKPKSRSYDYMSNTNCLVCQYLRSIGIKNPYVGGYDWRDGLGGKPHRLGKMEDVPIGADGNGFTYGAALTRARALMTEQ